jgi:hypothetical protein
VIASLEALDSALPNYAGRPDFVFSRTAPPPPGLVHIETKAIPPGRLLEGRELAQLDRIAEALLKRSQETGVINPEELTRELQRLVYSFRGPVRENLKAQVRNRIARALPDHLKSLVNGVQFEFFGNFPF